MRRTRERADYWTVKHHWKGIRWFDGPAGELGLERPRAGEDRKPWGYGPIPELGLLKDWAHGRLLRYQWRDTGIGLCWTAYLRRGLFCFTYRVCVCDSARGLRNHWQRSPQTKRVQARTPGKGALARSGCHPHYIPLKNIKTWFRSHLVPVLAMHCARADSCAVDFNRTLDSHWHLSLHNVWQNWGIS